MATIGVFDSGCGGLSVLREIVRLLPEERYIYFADSAHCPYGGLAASEIADRARAVTEILLSLGADIIVVACNTATAAAISILREEYPDVRFIGMEPAVKPAATGTRSGVVGVLATEGTLKGSKYLTAKGRISSGVKIVEKVGRGFVELVESGTLDGPEAESVVRRSLQPLLDAGADTIVLGCTHYPFLGPVIRRIAGPGVSIIDPAPSVARHLIYVMVEERLLSEAAATRALARVIEHEELSARGSSLPLPSSPSIDLYSSGDPTTLRPIYALAFER